MTQTEIFSFVVQTLYWFFLYGCIGWGVEVVYAAIKERRLVNRGFLCGPICPIYGCVPAGSAPLCKLFFRFF